MSSLLQEAIMDAKKIRDAAKKVALNSLKEKYSSEFKKTFKTQLRKISEAGNPFQDDESGMGDELGGDPEADLMDNGDLGGDMGGDDGMGDLFGDSSMGGQSPDMTMDQGDKSLLDQTPAAFDPNSSSDDQEIEIDLGEIQKTIDQDLGNMMGTEDRSSFDGLGDGEEGLDEGLPGQPESQQGLPGDSENDQDLNLDDEMDFSKDEDVVVNRESLSRYLDFEEDFSNKINEVTAKNKSLSLKINSLLEENKNLRDRLLHTNEALYKSNIDSTKLVYKNKILVDSSLNERQKKSILESIEKLSDSEIEVLPNIYSVLKEAVGAADNKSRKKESLTEILSSKTTTNHMVGDNAGTKSKEGVSEGFDKWRKLAKLIKD